MKNEIKINLDNPSQLEKLYREDKARFKKAFEQVYPEIAENISARIWNERLHFEQPGLSWGAKNELALVIILSFIAGLIAKLPFFLSLEPDYFYQRNIALVVFPMLVAYFAWKQSLSLLKIITVSIAIVISALYINLLPGKDTSDTLLLACIHLPLFLWTVLGYTFTGDQLNNFRKRIDFLRYNGDLIVMSTVIVIAGAILSAITINLFALINIQIEEYYFRNIAIWGLAAVPMAATYLVQSNPQLVKNVSPVIAKVFTPLVLVMLIAYLIAIVYTGKDPYNDREFLFVFNALLIGVMAIIVFSVAETSKNTGNKFGILLLLALSIVTIIVNGIALSAILFRITEWGITPNRLVVLGGNVLILIHLLIVAYRLFKALRDDQALEDVEKSIAFFLPVYSAWTLLVAFGFPLLFNFR
jgi:hypothetical protein